MTRPGADPDVIVVGGGVIGLSISWRAAQAGMAVTVVDPEPGHGATWAAAGMLAPATEAHYGEETLLGLNLLAAERWPEFAAELEALTGLSTGYRTCGTLAVALDSGDLAAIDELHLFQQKLGLGVQRLSGRECRGLEPALAPGIRGGVYVPEDHQVDNRLLVGALLAACEIQGVAFVRGEVTDVMLDPDVAGTSGAQHTHGVRLGDGSEIAASAVVLAAGCRTGNIGGLADGLLPPIRPVKGQLLRLRCPGGPLLQRTVRGLSHGGSCYMVPRDGGEIVLGATVEERGFDTSVQAGAVYELLRDARLLVPGVTEMILTECLAGLRPGSPDNSPFIGPIGLGGPRGLAIASGHYRNGILLAPVTAEGIVQWLQHGTMPESLNPFAVDRPIR